MSRMFFLGFLAMFSNLAVCAADVEAIKKPKILVVGGGIAGLSVTIALERQGIDVDTIEKRKQFDIEGAGIALPANAVWALTQLGMGEDLDLVAKKIPAMTFSTSTGDVLVKENIMPIHHAGVQFMALDRATLHDLLLSHLKTKPSMGVTVSKLQEREDGLVDVVLSNGETRSYDLVIGADGIHSQIRSHLLGKEQFNYQGISLWRTIVDCPEGLDHPVYMLGADRVLLLYPINNKKLYVYGHVVSAKKLQDVPEKRVEIFQKLFGNFGGFAPQALAQITDNAMLIPGVIDSSPSIYWGNGRNILLIGDARAAFSPMLQQGGAQAIEDAYVLGDIFAKEVGKNVAEIIEKFVNRRQKRVQWIMEQSDRRIKALNAEESAARDAIIREKGAPNVTAFKLFMRENP